MVPQGFDGVAKYWDGVCSYTGGAKPGSALCNVPSNTHSWKTPAQYNGGFICGKTAVARRPV